MILIFSGSESDLRILSLIFCVQSMPFRSIFLFLDLIFQTKKGDNENPNGDGEAIFKLAKIRLILSFICNFCGELFFREFFNLIS